jgi:hypothetical protein
VAHCHVQCRALVSAVSNIWVLLPQCSLVRYDLNSFFFYVCGVIYIEGLGNVNVHFHQ